MKTDNIILNKHSRVKELDDKNAISPLSKTEKIVLVGNPNVGKSCFFNYLSGIYVDVSNFPGTTVAITKSYYKGKEIYDTPGIYGVGSFNDEEKVARDIIISADKILNVVNSLHLERDLFLTLQLIEMGKKISVLLNFTDEVKKRKIKIDSSKLSELLGVEVIETAAINNYGFEKLDFAIENARVGKQQLELNLLLDEVIKRTNSQAEALLIMEGDQEIAKINNLPFGTPEQRERLYINRRNKVNEIVDQIEYEDTKKGEFFNKLGRLSLNPFTGIPILIIMLVLVYFFIGDLVSQRITNYTENTLGKGIFEYYTKSFISNFTPVKINVQLTDEKQNIITQKDFNFPNGMNNQPALKKEFENLSKKPGAVTTFHFINPLVKLFFGEFGVITMTTTYLIFLLLPLVIGFYLVMAFLEDSGYLPRLATMLDRTFNKLGLNGKAVIPIMLGFGCVTMANITTRILGTNREKTIVTAILQFVIPCSAQLAVITVLLSGAGIEPLLIYISVIFGVLIILSTILNKMLPGESSPLLIDLPVMQLPRLKNILKKTYYRSVGFMKEAGFWFFVGALGVGIMQITGLLTVWQNILAPITTSWLKLPREAATAFVMGIVRRDFGAAGLFDMKLTVNQITVAIITITLFVPCIASFVVMLKERGWKEGLSIWFGTWVTAFLIGGIVAQILI
ncbi:FeoB small GTPase domain-containing protein [Melioribacteraceae bacterium 4301-Me]|uniref:FeoB small GTPase domain-containing protein n=1 Tax=Pyranulibacter aquaticus TaxID=3163344 RepID=UPI0035972F5D